MLRLLLGVFSARSVLPVAAQPLQAARTMVRGRNYQVRCCCRSAEAAGLFCVLLSRF